MRGRIELRSLLLPAFVIAAAGLVLGLRFLTGGWLLTDDAPIHTLWAQQFVRSFNAGVLYPRWVPDTNLGLGSAAFIFYPPLTLYTYVAAGFFISEIPRAMAVSAVAGLIASGASMYVLSRRFMGSPAALVSAVLYMAMPYHMFDIYYRSSMAEFWAFMWPPLIIYFIHAADERRVFSFTGLAVCFSGLVMTHLPTTVIIVPFVMAYVAWLFFVKRNFGLLLARAAAFVAGISLSAVYMLPVFLERKYVNISAITAGSAFDFRNNFLFSPATGDWFNRLVAGMAALALLLCAACLIVFIARKASRLGPKENATFVFFSLSGFFAYFMMTSFSQPVWEAIGVLENVQFPWRFMTVLSLFAALSAGALYAAALLGTGAWRTISLMAITVLILANGATTIGVIRDFRGFDPSAGVSIRADMGYQEMQRNYSRYNPKDKGLAEVTDYRPLSSTGLISGDKYAIAMPKEMARKGIRAMLVRQGGQGGYVEIIGWAPQRRAFRLDVRTPDILLIKTFYYPGWTATVNGKPAKTAPDPSTGLIAVNVPPGSYDVTLSFNGGMWYKTGKAVSLVSVLLLAALIAWDRRMRGR